MSDFRSDAVMPRSPQPSRETSAELTVGADDVVRPTEASGTCAGFDAPSDFQARYSGEALLGRGGMGEVFSFRDERIGRTVAVKRLSAARQGAIDARARFVREAMVQGQLEHPSIVPVYDVGVDERGCEYFTMRRIRGRTLGSLIHGVDDPPTRARMLRIFAQLCLAVEHAHARGVIHRDLKPDNVMVGDFGEVYVLDWGIARIIGADAAAEPIDPGTSRAGETRVGKSMGTPGYMSPEQWDDARQVDARADVYSLGAILFEILTGERLHEHGPELKIMYATTMGLVETRPSVRSASAEIPPELDALCVRATTSALAERCASAREIADAIDSFLEGDRDASLRSAMAGRHRARAAGAADLALGDSEDADAHRAVALREAGRAIALDPGDSEAMRIAVKVMVTPPKRMPAEVAAELERDDILGVRIRARFGSLALSCFLGIAGFALWLGVLNWLPFYGLVGFLAAGVVGVWLAFQRFVPDSAVANCVDVGTALAFVSVSFSSGFVGPGLVVPALATALTTGAFVGTLERRRWIIVVMGLLSFCVPYFAEWFGLVTPVYTYGDHGIRIAATMTNLTEFPSRLGILTGGVAAIVFPIFVIWPSLRAAAAYREQVVTQAWQFRQLLPSTDV